MARTTDAAVRLLFPDGADKPVTHYVNDANVLVTEVLGASSLTEQRLEMIERYLAAHLYVLGEHEGGIFEEEIGETKEKRGSTFTLGHGLKLTRWGQMVLALDTTHSFLEEMAVSGSDKKSAKFRVV